MHHSEVGSRRWHWFDCMLLPILGKKVDANSHNASLDYCWSVSCLALGCFWTCLKHHHMEACFQLITIEDEQPGGAALRYQNWLNWLWTHSKVHAGKCTCYAVVTFWSATYENGFQPLWRFMTASWSLYVSLEPTNQVPGQNHEICSASRFMGFKITACEGSNVQAKRAAKYLVTAGLGFVHGQAMWIPYVGGID